jgi:hypothetical protein
MGPSASKPLPDDCTHHFAASACSHASTSILDISEELDGAPVLGGSEGQVLEGVGGASDGLVAAASLDVDAHRCSLQAKQRN